MDRFVEDMQKNIKLIKKELLVENIDDLKRLFKCRITNEYSAIKSNGERQWYRHPDLDNEYKAFQEDIKDYCYKHHRYKHYKNKKKYGFWDCNYKPPLVNISKTMFDNIDKASIKFNVKTGKDTILQYLSESY